MSSLESACALGLRALTRLRRPCALLLLSTLPACLFFDSRWGEAERSQRRVAKHYAASELKREDSSHVAPSVTRRLTVRALATRQHAAEVRNWEARFRAMVADANVLLAEYGVSLDVVSTAAWQPRTREDTLEALVADLHEADPGEDVDWVVGLVGSTARLEVAFHQLGMAAPFDKHIVLRAANDVLDHRAIDEGFSELSEKERDHLYHSRQAHKARAVLLHELGHSLGAVHVRSRASLMHALYSNHMAGFGPSASRVLRAALTAHDGAPRAAAGAVLKELETGPGDWVPAERDAQIAWLSRNVDSKREAEAVPRPATPSGSAQSKKARTFGVSSPMGGEAQAQVQTLAPADAARFARALEERKADRPRQAWDIAKPLFDDYPDEYAVQELRCQLASSLGLSWDDVRNECASLMRLTPGLPRSFGGQ